MEKLTFSTGKKQYELNGGQILEIIPTDPRLMKRLYDTFESLDKSQTTFERTGNELEDNKAFFEYVERMDEEMQEKIDGIFGVHIDRVAFDGASLFAMADGLPLWANFIFAVMDQMDVTMLAEHKAQNPRLKKLMAKYNRK